MKTNKKTYYQLILDCSGSMNACARAAVDGFNAQMVSIAALKQQYPDQEFFVSLTTFSDQVKFDVDCEEAARVKKLVLPGKQAAWLKSDPDEMVYITSGSTALYDAIGTTLHRLQRKISEELEQDKATAVVVIITDGEENSSRKFTHVQIQSIIARLESSENWTFTYLGATPDAVEIGQSLNISSANSHYFDINTIDELQHNLAHSMKEYAGHKQINVKPKNFVKKQQDN